MKLQAVLSRGRVSVVAWVVLLVVFSVTLPMAVVLSTNLARKSFEKVKLGGQTIRVKGYAEQAIVSDRAEWSTRIVERDADRTAAYQRLEVSRTAVLNYLAAHGFEGEDVTLGPVVIQELFEQNERGQRTNTIEGYEVTQSLSIASDRVEAVAVTARDAGTLIGSGIQLESAAPKFLYTRLDDLKLSMLQEASANAFERAELLVGSSGDDVGRLVEASQGVFQITPAFSTEVSNSGMNDTTSLNKVISAVVTMEYLVNEK